MVAIESLLEQAMLLPEEKREELAVALLESLRDDGDDLDDEDRRRLHESLERSDEDVRAGRVSPAWEVIAELRARAAAR